VDYRIGPGMTSLLMIFIALCMAALAVLSMASVQVDSVLNSRNQESTVSYYQAEAALQKTLADIDGQLVAARAEAGGDLAAYESKVLALQAALSAPKPAASAGEQGGSAQEAEAVAKVDAPAMSALQAPETARVAQAEREPLHLVFAAPMGKDRQIEAVLDVPRSLTGKRYTVRSHMVTNLSTWDAEQDIGMYQPAASD
jgi:hypothetical protein